MLIVKTYFIVLDIYILKFGFENIISNYSGFITNLNHISNDQALILNKKSDP